MTLDEIKGKVEEIRQQQENDAQAHLMESELYLEFIRAVAQDGPPEWRDKAAAVLATQELPFDRG